MSIKLRMLRFIQYWADKRIEKILAKDWEPTGKDKNCDPGCDYCGYLCGRCLRP